jgi:hypothetical protein
MLQTFINGLQLKAEVEALKNGVLAEREKAVVRQGALNVRIRSFSSSKSSITGGLASINAELTGLQAAFPALAEGDAKDDMEARIKKLEYQKFLFETRNKDKGQYALVEIAHDLEVVEATIARQDAYIAMLDAKLATFP